MLGKIYRYRKYMVMRTLKVLHTLLSVAMFVPCWSKVYGAAVVDQAETALLMYVLYAVSLVMFFRTYRAYAVGMSRVSELVYSQCLTNVITAGVVYVLGCVLWTKLLNPLSMFGLILVQGCINAVWSVLANRVYFKMHAPKRTVIIYRKKEDLRKIEEIRFFANRFDVQKQIENPTDIHELIREIEGYQVVFVAGVNATLRNGIAKYCVENDVQAYIAPHVGDVIMSGAEHMLMFSVPVMRIRRATPKPEYLIAKRMIDMVVSAAALVLLSPVMLVTALVIHLYDKGPVFYKQVRLTRDGRRFEILKFRSMKVNAEKDGVARLASENDDRITPVGKIIRACRIDELPQLINILMGDMTIVGPRPERPEIAAQYEKEMPAFSLRLQVKAGLTGLAQVYGRYNTEPYDKLQMDLMYINKMSLFEDFRLMFATVKILFMRESTKGISEGQTTAKVEEKKSA